MNCCDHALNRGVKGLRGPAVIGLEIPCHDCGNYWRYETRGTSSIWIRHDRVGDFVTRESDPIATEAREQVYERILGKQRAR